jgi:hypothetical protein
MRQFAGLPDGYIRALTMDPIRWAWWRWRQTGHRFDPMFMPAGNKDSNNHAGFELRVD